MTQRTLLLILVILARGLYPRIQNTVQQQPFKGVIGKTLPESKECWPESVKAPKGAPNVI